jgi:sarcosine oxidase subunit gamma
VADRNPFQLVTIDVRVAELQPQQLLVLRLRRIDTALSNALSAAMECPWPIEPNTAAVGKCEVLWLAPGEWLLVGGNHELMKSLETASDGHLYHLSEVTDSRVVFRISGPGTRDLFAKGCSLDLHRRSFQSGRCAQTLFAQIPVLLHQRLEEPRFDLYADRSYADYFKAWARDACTTQTEQ